MFSSTLNSRTGRLEQQFYAKVKYNFKLHVLLCLKGNNWNRQDMLHKIYLLDGYRCHKVVKYGSNWSHLHIKFTQEQKATEAVDFFKAMDSDLTAVLVDDLLKDWYSFELRSNYSPPWTLAVVDVVGTPPQCLNFLTENLLNSILEDFGQPYLLPYTAALTETHVQILFSSMTEALAACMAFGQWYRMNQKSDQFFYRVRISPSNKETLLIKNSGGIPEEAFKLDYFLNERQIQHPGANNKGSGFPQKADKVNFHGRHNQRNEYVTEKFSRSHRSITSQMKFRTPLICIPVIAPPIRNAKVVAPQDNGFDPPVVNSQGAVGVRPREETGFQKIESYKDSVTSAMNKLSAFDKMQADALANCIEISNSFQPMTVQTMSHEISQDYYCGKALVFERQLTS